MTRLACRPVVGLALTLLLANACGGPLVVAPGMPESPPPPTHAPADNGDPVALFGAGSTSSPFDGIVPGKQFAFTIEVKNRAAEPADVEAIELVSPTAGLVLDGAAPFERTPNPLGIATAMDVTPALLGGIQARRTGASIGSQDEPAWGSGGWLVLVLRVRANGYYESSGVRVRYRVAGIEHETILPASLAVCAGAVVTGSGEACPFE